MKGPLLKAAGVSRYFGPVCAVTDFNLELNEGEVLGLLGPNGAGKTSTLQMLSGNLAMSAGQISIQDYDLKDEPRQAKSMIGYLPEQPPLYRDLTVDEYLRYCAKLKRIPRDNVDETLNETKRRCGLAQSGERLIGHLSKGFQQRVGIAQAVIHSPAVVILDEPTVGLDPIQLREIRSLIRDLGAAHGIILSTHLLTEVQAVCDRVIIIHRGRTLFSDTLADLSHRHERPVLRVTFKAPPEPEALAEIEGVTDIEVLSEGGFRLAYDPTVLDAARIAEVAAHMRWGLAELRAEHATLEQIFVNLIYKDSQVQEQVA
jgi:ABC-2 type transport system ATP-binding protein